VAGRGDIAAANLTMTPERRELVDFSIPAASNVSEILVTHRSAPPVESVQGLSGFEIHARQSSSYWESLQQLNKDLTDMGLEPATLVPAEEFLEDEDLLEMVNAGIVPAVIIDSHKANLWVQVFDNIQVHPNAAVRTGGEIGWAFRHESPQLAEMVNAFAKGHSKGSLFGNVLLKRYFEDNKWVRNNLAEKDRQLFEEMIDLFRKYGAQYNFDHLMLAALAYQESRLDHATKSRAGAVGVMQMLPSTARDPNVGISDITDLENNIHAGTKYLRFLRDRYFSDEAIDPVNQQLFTFAAYNAGPAKVRKLRTEAQERGLDPNKWFRNVELIAARRIGRETVQYVSNISKYHIAYQQVVEQMQYKSRNKNVG
jgi:membrane-bound lytic murein transglycosylase MltF